jgi:GDP-mannose 6-dehydrogenase
VHFVVVGLGYVGTVVAACLTEAGNDVHAVDVNETKIRQLNAGESPIIELGLAELVAQNVRHGRLRASSDIATAAAGSDVIIICVGTPSAPSGDVRLADLERVAEQLGQALGNHGGWPLIMLTSTVPPGTTESVLIPILEKTSGKKCGADFGVAFSPEFLREGSALHDYYEPAKTVIGATDERALKVAQAVVAPFTRDVIATDIRTAESVKLADNSWHALKVAFANEVGRFCEANDIDSLAVMEIFRSDTRLNVSAAYLTPGFAFGGSCLPKDLRTITYRARVAGVSVPILDAILASNAAHIDLAVRRLQAIAPEAKRVALLGVAFKSGTDDLRESPNLELTERLIGKGYDLRIHDEHVNLSRLVGTNRRHVETVLPHIASLLSEDLEAVLEHGEAVVVAQGNPAYARLCEVVIDRPILDLTGVARPATHAANYAGLTW